MTSSASVVAVAMGVALVALLLLGAVAASRRARARARLKGWGEVGRGSGTVRLRKRQRRPIPSAALSPPRWLASALGDAAIEVAALTVWRAWLGTGVAVVLLGWIGLGPSGAVLGLLASACIPPTVLRARRGRADSRLDQELPVALESIARSLRSGASVHQAIGEVAQGGPTTDGSLAGATRAGASGPAGTERAGAALAASPSGLASELADVSRQAHRGSSLTGALEALALRRPTGGVRLAVSALCLGLDTGGAQARAIDGVAATLRDRLAVQAEVRALASQARMSALVIGVAPLVFGAFATATDPRTSDFLFRTPVGLAFVAVGLLLDGLGWLWMRRLCRVTE